MSSFLVIWILLAIGNLFFCTWEPELLGVDGEHPRRSSLTVPPQPPVWKETPAVLRTILVFARGLPCCLVKWQGLISLSDGRLAEAQTSGAGWVPCVVYRREHELGGPCSQGAAGSTV